MQAAEKEYREREAVVGRIVSEHARFLYRVAHSLLRHPQDAEDAVQDALLKLYRGDGWRGLSGPESADVAIRDERAYLARVVWRAALDRRTTRAAGVEDYEAEGRVADHRPSPELVASASDERALLHELIDALPEDLRQPLLLSAMEELSSREIGEAMGLPEGTVRTRLMRARARLKEAFETRCAREPAQVGSSR